MLTTQCQVQRVGGKTVYTQWVHFYRHLPLSGQGWDKEVGPVARPGPGRGGAGPRSGLLKSQIPPSTISNSSPHVLLTPPAHVLVACKWQWVSTIQLFSNS